MPITSNHFHQKVDLVKGKWKVKSCSNLPTILHPINVLTKVSTPNAVVLTARDGQAEWALTRKPRKIHKEHSNIGVQDGLSRFKLRDLEICWNTYKYLYFKLAFIFCVFSVCLFLLFAV